MRQPAGAIGANQGALACILAETQFADVVVRAMDRLAILIRRARVTLVRWPPASPFSIGEGMQT